MLVYPIKFGLLEEGEIFYVPSPDCYSSAPVRDESSGEVMYVDECVKILSETKTNAVLINLSTGFHMDKDETVYCAVDSEGDRW